MQKIMFNDRFGLTQAVLERRKTQTRRFVKLKMINDYYSMLGANETGYICGFNDSIEEFLLEHYSRYKVGEIVAVAQSYYDAKVVGDTTVGWARVFDDGDAGYANKMFVKASLMPHQIKITNVRVQRLQDISDEDIMREGINKGEFYNTFDEYYFYVNEGCFTAKTPRKAYAALIDKIGGKGTWDSNSYVFVYDFELVR